MRVLLTSISALGHVHPMVPLALALRDAGHQVRWLTGPDTADRLRRVGIDAVPLGPPFESLRTEFWGRYPATAALPPRTIADRVFPGLFGEVAAAAMLPAASRITEDWHPDLVINDAAELAGPIAAARIGVPAVTHGFGALTPRHRVAAASEIVAPLWRAAGLEPRPFAGLYDSLYLDIYPASLQSGGMGHVPNSRSMRPIAFDDAGDAAVDPWLERTVGADPLVYLTFGTVARDHARLGVALDAIAALPLRVLVTVGASGDPMAFGPRPDHVRIEHYVPQTQVLAHCDVVVSHAGSGTFLATLARGVPQLCLPQAADQFLNADACLASGAGLALDPAMATGPAIRDAVDRLLTEAGFRERAGELAAEIADMPHPSVIVPALEALAAR